MTTDTTARKTTTRKTAAAPKAAPAPVVPEWVATLGKLAEEHATNYDPGLPVTGGQSVDAALAFHEGQADRWSAWNEDRAVDGKLGWDGILLEDLHNACCEGTAKALFEFAALALVAAEATRRVEEAGK